MDAPKRKYIKLEVNKTYHVRLLFDTPFATEKEFNGRTLFGYKYAFLDLDNGEEFTCIIGRDSKTAAVLLDKRKGDEFDLTLKTFEINGQMRKAYNIQALYSTPVPAGHSSIQRPQTAQPAVQEPHQSQAVDIDDISW